MKKIFATLCSIAACTILFSSCSSDDPEIVATAHVDLVMPDGLTNPVADNIVLTVKNISTGQTSTIVSEPSRAAESTATFDGHSVTFTVPEGLYNISLDGDVTYEVEGNKLTSKLRGVAENVTISRAMASTPLKINTYLYKSSADGGGFVLAELFYAMTLTPENKQYSGDYTLKKSDSDFL